MIKNFNTCIDTVLIPFYVSEINKQLQHEDSKATVKLVISEMKNTFAGFPTEHNRFNIYRNQSIYNDPEEFKIGSKTMPIDKNDFTIKYIPRPIFAPIIRIYKTLKIFSEIPEVFEQMKDYTNKLKNEKDIVRNVVLGKLWKTKYAFFFESNIFPVFLFFDDFEPGNSLGSHGGQQKIGGLYIYIPCLPPHAAVALCNIFLVTMFYSHDREKFGNKAVFQEVIDELNALYNNGIDLKINEKTIKVRFQS